MAVLWIMGAALALMAMAFVVSPLMRRRAASVDHAEGALAIFADQIAEVDRDVGRGIISPAEAEAAKVEIKRRMLVVARNRGPQKNRDGGRGLVLAMALAVPAAAGVVYWQTGNPAVPSMPFAERASERAQDAEVVELTNRLRARLLADENGGPTDGWVLLGQTYMRMGRYGDAALAFARVSERPDTTSAMLTQYAEALIAAENGVVTNRAAIVVERAAELDPLNPAATYYWAQWLEQEGRAVEAVDVMIARITDEGQYAPWMDVFVEQINRMKAASGAVPVSLDDLIGPQQGGPSAADVEAAQALSEEERAAFIQSMVDGLAARLEEEPNDLDGWMQLGRAYMVLGRRADAFSAYQQAERLLADLPGDDIRREIVGEGLRVNAP